ncbi:MAG: hypothetical protein OES79_02050, partial [Planctomycetota bacterium]|nr:hypothetical protein [Planctomycetota bacterium]
MYSGLQGTLLRAVDLGFLGILFLAPLFMGGRHPVGRLVFVSFVAVMSVAWFSRQCLLSRSAWRSSIGQWIFLGSVLLLLIQLIPLSPGMFATLSPDAATLLPLWSPGAETPALLGTWSQLSMHPAKTQGGLALLLAYGLTFLITTQRVNGVEDIHRILRWVALAALAMAGIGLVQYLTSNGKFLWTYEHPHRVANQV